MESPGHLEEFSLHPGKALSKLAPPTITTVTELLFAFFAHLPRKKW